MNTNNNKRNSYSPFRGLGSILLILILMSCNKSTDVSEWSDEQINDWFNQSEWVKLTAKPHESIDLRQFVEQNVLNPTSWEAALQFMKESDFNSMEVGRYELAEGGTFATVSDYTTKDLDTAYYEAHRKYIDIQYVPKGQEYIGLTSMNNIDTITQPYKEENDIEFFQKPDENMLLADASKFFVLFPSDGHKPCIKVDSNEVVRKVVVKIPVHKL